MVGRRVGGTFGVFAPPRANPEEALPVPPLPEKEGPDSVDILVPPIVGKVTGAGCRLSGPPERGVTDPGPYQVNMGLNLLVPAPPREVFKVELPLQPLLRGVPTLPGVRGGSEAPSTREFLFETEEVLEEKDQTPEVLVLVLPGVAGEVYGLHMVPESDPPDLNEEVQKGQASPRALVVKPLPGETLQGQLPPGRFRKALPKGNLSLHSPSSPAIFPEMVGGVKKSPPRGNSFGERKLDSSLLPFSNSLSWCYTLQQELSYPLFDSLAWPLIGTK